jgi:5-methylcytosine-specific restriction enzyme subunit McrC
LLFYGRAHCQFDELRHDVLHNQIIKATLYALSNVKELDPELRHSLFILRKKLPDISDIRLSPSLFHRVQLSRNNGHYDLLLKICELINYAMLPEQEGQASRFSDILEDETRMSDVFERFVRNFLEREQKDFSVGVEKLSWNAKISDPEHARFLPEMRTDITLRSRSRIMVIDAKYHKETLAKYKGQEKIKSENLYQLYAYVKHVRFSDQISSPVEGLLLYSTINQTLDLKYVIDGHPMRIKTINLNQHWSNIHGELLSMLVEGAPSKVH